MWGTFWARRSSLAIPAVAAAGLTLLLAASGATGSAVRLMRARAAMPAAAHGSSQHLLRLRIPLIGKGAVYKLTLSGKLATGERVSLQDITVRVTNLHSLPTTVRAAYAELAPKNASTTWSDAIFIAINHPRHLSARDASRAGKPRAPQAFMDTLLEFAANGSVSSWRAEYTFTCKQSADHRAFVSAPRTGVLGPWVSTALEIATRTLAVCHR